MSTQELKVFNSLKKIILCSVYSGILIALSGCGDLVEETETEACNNAIDERDYDTALSACTSRKDLASAWMGKAGYDIVNLIKATSSTPSQHTKPSSLGKDDPSGAVILNILRLSTDVYSDDAERATEITKSKDYLDMATALLHPAMMDNGTSVSKDEILLNTFALAFSMQLYQVITYDNATTASSVVPSGNSLNTCPEVNGADGTEAQAMLKAVDGHLWTSERNAIQCQLMITAIDSIRDNASALQIVADNLSNWTEGSKLPDPISDLVCNPVKKLVDYLGKLTDSINQLALSITLSGDNTKAITDAQTSTNTLLTKIGCNE